MNSLIPYISRHRVSSVYNRDNESFGRKYLFDGDIETCWNSEQGVPQHVMVEFDGPVQLHEIHIQFQGGFAGKETKLIDMSLNADICPLHPDDNNKLQKFTLPVDQQNAGRSRIKVQFLSSTDFYGRIIIYSMDFLGRRLSKEATSIAETTSSVVGGPETSDGTTIIIS